MPTYSLHTALYRYCVTACLLLCPLVFTAQPRQTQLPVPVLQTGHDQNVIALRADGHVAVTGGSDGLLKWWESKTGLLIRTVVAHSGLVTTVAFDDAGSRLLSGGEDGFIKVWDAQSGRLLLSFEATKGTVGCAAFSPRGDLIASCVSGLYEMTGDDPNSFIYLWDARTGNMVNRLSGHRQGVTDLDFSRAGDRLVSGSSDGTVKIWSVAGELLSTISAKGFDGFVDFSPDGRTIAVATYSSNPSNQELSFHDAQTGRKLRGFNDHETWGAKAISANWRYFVTAEDEALKVWNVGSGELARTVRIKSFAGGVAIDADGETLAACDTASPLFSPSANSGDGTPLISFTTGLAVSRDRRLVAWGGGDKVYVWDNAAAALLQVFEGHTMPVNEVAFSPDGRMLASCSTNEVKLWSTSNGVWLADLTAPRAGAVQEHGWNGSQSVAFSPDGKSLATGMLKVTKVKEYQYVETLGLRVWDVRTRRLAKVFDLTSQKPRLPRDPDGEKDAPYWVRSVAFSPDGGTIAWDDGSTRVLLLNRRTWTVRPLVGHAREVNSIAFSPDGRRLVSASFDKTVRVWDVTSRRVIHTLRGHQRRVTTARFSPDGRVVVSGGIDRTAKLWDANSGASLATLENHDGPVTSAGVSADGKTVFTTGFDGRVNLWSLAGRTLNATLVADAEGAWACFSPDGFYNGNEAEKFLAWRVGDAMYPASAYRSQYFKPNVVLARLNGVPAPLVAAQPTPTPIPIPIRRPTPTPTPPTPTTAPVERGVEVRMRNERGDTGSYKLYDGSYALLIGNSDYTDWGDLPGVRTDMTEVRNALKKQGFNVVSFDAKGAPVFDRPAMNLTQDEFHRQLTLFIRAYGQDGGNRLLVYYAGHGYTATLPDKRKMGYLVMRDAPLMPSAEEAVERGLSYRQLAPFNQTSVSMDEMNTFARRILARHALFVFDSCFAGTVLFREGEPRVPAYISAEVTEPVRAFLTAGNELQRVRDDSVFRRAFVDGIEGAADAEFGGRPKDGYVLTTELYIYIKQQVSEYTRREQTPTFGKIFQQELARGDFVFVYSDAARGR